VAAATSIQEGEYHMARTKTAARPTPDVAEATPEHAPAIAPAADADGGIAVLEPPAGKAAEPPAYAADPHEKISVSLSGTPGGPAMHLLRSHKYNQMQIRFDRGQPDEQYLKILTDAGWKDRTASEGVFTKQIDRDARWQSVREMEQEFKDVANAIRKDKGLGPVLEMAA
jgi:hypothetical protein